MYNYYLYYYLYQMDQIILYANNDPFHFFIEGDFFSLPPMRFCVPQLKKRCYRE